MAKYIDADKLKAHYAWWGEDSSERTLFDTIIDVQPAADVRPVVFCKDCRHRDPEDHKCDCGQLERVGCAFSVDDDYFCAYGVKREES